MSLTRLSAAVLADKLAAKEVSSVEVTQAHLDRIADVEHAVHAFLQVSGDAALAIALNASLRVRPAAPQRAKGEGAVKRGKR